MTDRLWAWRFRPQSGVEWQHRAVSRQSKVDIEYTLSEKADVQVCVWPIAVNSEISLERLADIGTFIGAIVVTISVSD